jgi:hypothetical protein
MFEALSFLRVTNTPASVKVLLFVSGFAILSVEILGVRILAPYVGASMPVWGSVIGVTLLGGMVGYYGGGTVADTTRDKRILLLLTVLAGACIALIPEFRSVASPLMRAVPYTVGALIGSAVLFLVPTTALSALITYTIRTHVRTAETIGQVHGDLYAIATAGSIVGVFGTSYALIPFYSVPHILYGLGGATALLGVYLYAREMNTSAQ